jgi:hypothetical protein
MRSGLWHSPPLYCRFLACRDPAKETLVVMSRVSSGNRRAIRLILKIFFDPINHA